MMGKLEQPSPQTFDPQLVYKICGLSAVKISSDIHDGLYTWAPATVAGKARCWTEVELLALMVVAAMAEGGSSRKLAYDIGKQVLRALQSDPSLDELHVDVSVLGYRAIFIDEIRLALRERI